MPSPSRMIPVVLLDLAMGTVVTVAATPAPCHDLEYRETTGRSVYRSTSVVDTLRNHRHVHNEDRTSVDDYLVDTATGQCVRWIYQPRNQAVRLLAVDDGHTIRLSGTRRNGKTFQRMVSHGAIPWAQEWMSYLGTLALSTRGSATFCSLVAPTLECATFCGRVVGEESVIIDRAMVPAVHVRVSFSGNLSVAWHGDYWFRSSDGRFVRFEGRSLPGLPESIYELIDTGCNPKPRNRY